MKSDANPLADLLLDPEHVYLLDDADFDSFTAQLNLGRVEPVVAADSDEDDVSY